MANHSKLHFNRRELVLFVSAHLASIATIGGANAAPNKDFYEKVRNPILAFNCAQAILHESTESAQRKFLAAVLTASFDGENTKKAAKAFAKSVEKVALGQSALEIKGLLSKLGQAAVRAEDEADEVSKQFIDIKSGLEGLVSKQAASALWITGLSAKYSGAGLEFSNSIPTESLSLSVTHSLARIITKSAVQGSGIHRIVLEAPFIASVPLRFEAKLEQLVEALPTQSQKFMRELDQFQGKSLDEHRNTLEAMFSDNFKSVFIDLQSKYAGFSNLIENGKSLFEVSADLDFQSASSDLQAVGAIGAFIFGEFLGDKKTAQKINQGMQVASAALQIGMLISTGGLGALATIGGLSSSLGALGGLMGGGGENQAIMGMLSQISQQIEQLRKEMHARFDRLEELQTRALVMLQEIAEELKSARIELSIKLGELKSEVTQLSDYVRGQDRHKSLSDFAKLTSNARSFISTPPKDIDRVRLLAHDMLHYAINEASSPAFLSEASLELRQRVQEVGRVDLALGLMERANQLLGLDMNVKWSANPIEWARGVNAYLELEASFPSLANEETLNLRKMATEVGKVTRETVIAQLTAAKLKTAAEAFEQTGLEITPAIRDALQSIPLKDAKGELSRNARLELGAIPTPVISNERFPAREHAAYEKRILYLRNWEAKSNEIDLMAIDFDPIQWGVDSGRLSRVKLGKVRTLLNIQGPKTADLWTDQPLELVVDRHRIKQFIVTQTITEQQFSLLDREGKQIHKVSELNFSFLFRYGRGGNRRVSLFKAWDIRATGLTYDKLLDSLQPLLSDDVYVRRWLSDRQNLRQVKVEWDQFEEVTAALLLFVSAHAWRVTDQPDDPWNSSIAVRLPRDFHSIHELLSDLALGASIRNVELLGGIKEFPKKQIVQRVRAEALAGNQVRIPWKELGVRIDFPLVAEGTIRNWVKSGSAAALRLGNHVVVGSSIPLVDRCLLKLNGLVASSET